jgi:hypothetical protein
MPTIRPRFTAAGPRTTSGGPPGRPAARAALLAACWFAATAVHGPCADPEPAAPVAIIFDTDIGNDVDDVLALGMIHALVSRGECDLLAVTITKDNPLAAPFTDAINTFYGRGDIPVGMVRGGVTPEDGKYLPLAVARSGDSLRYPRSLASGGEAPEAVGLLRRSLAARPDGSVVIVQVGFFTNLARLLESPADAITPLPGRDLVARKVRLLSVMAGAFAPVGGKPHREYNVVTELPSARRLAAEWPTPILWSGFEVGIAMPYPPASIEADYRYVADHPLAESYRLYEPPPHARPTWDLSSVLAVVRPDRGYFGISPPGRVTVEADGTTTFVPAAGGRDRFLTVDGIQAARGIEAFVGLCSQPPCMPAPPAR